MKIGLKRLEKAGVLRYFLTSLEVPEREVFLACYQRKGASPEISEWWEDICSQALPKFTEPEPEEDIIIECIKEPQHSGKNMNRGEYRRCIWTGGLWYYGSLVLCEMEKNGDLFKDKNRAMEIKRQVKQEYIKSYEEEDVLVKHYMSLNQFYCPVFLGRTLNEGNINMSPVARLGVLYRLYDFMGDLMSFEEGIFDFQNLLVLTEDNNKIMLDSLTSKDIQSAIVQKVKHLKSFLFSYAKQLMPLCNYFGLRGPDDYEQLCHVIEEEYRKYNP